MNAKRLSDIVVALLGTLLFLPVWLVIIVAIYIEDQTPILFMQTRLGKNMKPFKIFKFRSMRDNKITRVGYWLRQTGLDETIQIVNIVKGDMSVVGPRPLTIHDHKRLKWVDNRSLSRWRQKPGITGLAQLYGGRGKRVTRYLEDYYSKNHSIFLDIKIIGLSFLVNVLGKKRVYKILRSKRVSRAV